MASRRVRVDQSHCNYHLEAHLRKEGWTALFRDPGRVSRGLGAVQAEVLRFFESRGLHIPDLVAMDGESTGLIVEIDAQFGRAEPSFQQYREHAADIMQALSTFAPSPVRNLLLAFCQIGSVRDSRRYFSSNVIDLLYFFPQPFAPSCVRRR